MYNIVMIKNYFHLERHIKGVANHYRIQILDIIATSEGISLEDIAKELDCSLKTAGEHTRRLFIAGLIYKKYRGRVVEHSLSPYGKTFHRFIKTFQHS